MLKLEKILFGLLAVITVLITINNYNKSVTIHHTSYVLKSYKNTVALYNNDKIIKTYDNIVLNTLPVSDIRNFEKGIHIATPAHAEMYLEDYE